MTNNVNTQFMLMTTLLKKKSYLFYEKYQAQLEDADRTL
jgi:hypothetical protein